MAEIESNVLKKLNKILKKKRLKIKIQEDGCAVMFIHFNLNQGWARIESAHWDSLKTMLFENDDEYTIFNDIHSKLDYVGLKRFQNSGLMCLENCASLEEMLLRLEIMFPDI